MKGLIGILGNKGKIKIKTSKSSSPFSFSKINKNWKIGKKVGVFDFDKDGVIDKLDCEPFNRKRQHRDPGDWMDTSIVKPEVAHTGKDWINPKKRYKRKPRVARYGKSNWTPHRKMIVKAIAKYSFEANPNWSEMQEQIYDKLYYKIYDKDYKKFPLLHDVIVVHDSKKKVYHFFVYHPDSGYKPDLLFSVTDADRKKYGDIAIARILKKRL